MGAPGFWEDQERAAQVSAEHARAGRRLSTYRELERDVEDLEPLAELAEELDSEQVRTQLVVALDAENELTEGSEAELWLDPTRMHLFDPASGENLTHGRGAATPSLTSA